MILLLLSAIGWSGPSAEPTGCLSLQPCLFRLAAGRRTEHLSLTVHPLPASNGGAPKAPPAIAHVWLWGGSAVGLCHAHGMR